MIDFIFPPYTDEKCNIYTYKEIIVMVNKKKYTHMEKGRAADRDCIRRYGHHV